MFQLLLFDYQENLENNLKDLEENLPFRKGFKDINKLKQSKSIINNNDSNEITLKKSVLINEKNGEDSNVVHDKELHSNIYNCKDLIFSIYYY